MVGERVSWENVYKVDWEEDSAGTHLPAQLWGLQLRLPFTVGPGGRGCPLCGASLTAEDQDPPLIPC